MLWKSCPLQRPPSKHSLTFRAAEEGFVAGGGEGKRTMRDKTHLHGSGVKYKVGFAHPLPGFSQQCRCAMQQAGACTTPQRHAFLNGKTRVLSLSHFIPSSAVLWGKFLQDASCYSLNPLSSLNSVKLSITKVSNDLLIKNCFCRAACCLQWWFSSLVNTWIFWLRFLSTVVSDNGSCPACASPQKCRLTSRHFLATQIYRRQFNCTCLMKVSFEAYS